MTKNSFLPVEKMFNNGKLVVPYYQRGYKWSLLKYEKDESNKTHLEKLLDDLESAYKTNPDQDYHLQGITVKPNNDAFELVDGQQRVTSLYMLLKRLGGLPEGASLTYNVRPIANNWLACVQEHGSSEEGPMSDNGNVQDICALRLAMNEIDKRINDQKCALWADAQGKGGGVDFILHHVKVIWVVLNTEPTRVFRMMNRDRAIMTQTDLVKAMLLSEASRQAFADLGTQEAGAHEWQINHLRSHFAREWDRWRKWWEAPAHHKFFNRLAPLLTGEPELSRLLRLNLAVQPTSNCTRQTGKDFSRERLLTEYEKLMQDHDGAENRRVEAVETFEELRKLQLILEEWYDDPLTHNWIGLILHGTKGDVGPKSIRKLLGTSDKIVTTDCLKKKYRMLSWADLCSSEEGASDRLASAQEPEVGEVVSEIFSQPVYQDNYILAAHQLLRRNVLRLQQFGLKFDFRMYEPKTNSEMRSLEHILPQSWFEQNSKPDSQGHIVDDVTGNSIGNLVLLPKGKNSSLGKAPFEEKRKIIRSVFLLDQPSTQSHTTMQHRDVCLLLHTLDVFLSFTAWGKEEIDNGTRKFINDTVQFYATEDARL